jgi:DNA-binding NarL/FixJ family response regulator
VRPPGLHITVSTVKAHIGRLPAELGAGDRAQLVIAAYENGLVRRR